MAFSVTVALLVRVGAVRISATHLEIDQAGKGVFDQCCCVQVFTEVTTSLLSTFTLLCLFPPLSKKETEVERPDGFVSHFVPLQAAVLPGTPQNVLAQGFTITESPTLARVQNKIAHLPGGSLKPV